MHPVKWSIGLKMALLVVVALGLLYACLLLAFSSHESENLNTLMFKQARVLTQQITLTRQWNAQHGGVYTIKRPGEKTNPYLYQVGPGPITPEITDTDGNVYTLKNPALMTRELSELTAKAGLVQYHLTSLKLINPVNTPDAFETDALHRFEKGEKEITRFESHGGSESFRYMVPLYINNGCLKCHGFQGYKVGDVRGGISLTLPMDTELELVAMTRNQVFLSGALLLLLISLLIILGNRYLITLPIRRIRSFAMQHMGSDQLIEPDLLARKDEIGELANSVQSSSREIANYQSGLQRLVDERTRDLEDLEAATKMLDQLSRTDPLTGLNNRRHLQQESTKLLAFAKRHNNAVTVLMLDIDHFKQFNDTYGHAAGDQALVHTTGILQRMTRPYDLVVRYGGEEFVLVMPDLDGVGGGIAAERIRAHIEAHPVAISGREVPITVSIGQYSATNITDIEQSIALADEALYRAKESGRNRVCIWSDDTPVA